MESACVPPSRSLNIEALRAGSDTHPDAPVGNSNVQSLDGPVQTAHVGQGTDITTFLATLQQTDESTPRVLCTTLQLEILLLS